MLDLEGFLIEDNRASLFHIHPLCHLPQTAELGVALELLRRSTCAALIFQFDSVNNVTKFVWFFKEKIKSRAKCSWSLNVSFHISSCLFHSILPTTPGEERQ